MLPRRVAVGLVCLASLTSLMSLLGADSETRGPGAAARPPRMDYGSMLTYTVGLPEVRGRDTTNLALKGMCIRLGDPAGAAVCFDTDLLRYYAGWTGGWLDLSKTHLTSSKGSYHALIQGGVAFQSQAGPGWARDEVFSDPRPIAAGPLPRDWGRYQGFYRHADRVVLRYQVGTTTILELPGATHSNGITIFSRTLRIEQAAQPLCVKVCDVVDAGDPGSVERAQDKRSLSVRGAPPEPGESATAVQVEGSGAELELVAGGRIQARLPAVSQPTTFRILLGHGAPSPALTNALQAAAAVPAPDLTSLCRGGPLRWPQVITVPGRLAQSPDAYVVDTVPIPESNPWNSWMRLAALDFFSDGRAAVSTWNGDVWLVTGLDESLGRVTWKRFAAGLFEPLGLKIVDDEVFVLCRDQLMRLQDLNRDGEADYYECYNNDTWLSPSYHAFAFDLQTDRAGNFYYARCGQRVDPALPLNGGLVRVSRDGARAELVASGLRAANGLAIGPNDAIVCGDNQGNWIPSSRLNWIQPGGFYGYLPHAHRNPPPRDYEPPICWLPMTADNSSAGQVWVTGDRLGPLNGQLLHLSYGKSSLFLVLLDEVEGVKQGGAVRLPLKFDSGIMRARIHPKDGQLWLCGLRGWQTSGGRDGALQRVRYTGKPLCLPSSLKVTERGLDLSFTTPLDTTSATNAENYALEQWNYLWSEKYGSPDFSVTDPARQGHDAVEVRSVTLSADGRTASLAIPALQPVMQMRIRFRLEAVDGTPVEHEIFNTIHRVPGARKAATK